MIKTLFWLLAVVSAEDEENDEDGGSRVLAVSTCQKTFSNFTKMTSTKVLIVGFVASICCQHMSCKGAGVTTGETTEDTAAYAPYNPNDYPTQQQQQQFPMFSQAPPGAAYGPPPPPPPPEWDFNQPIQNDANQFNF